MSTRYGSATVTTPSDREIVITRTFEAPTALVFEAVTTPEHVRRWWGLESLPLEVCDIDLRVGGHWRYTTRTPDGTEMGWHGTYQELDPPRRIVSTEVFEAFPDAESTNTMVLTEVDGGTTLTTTVLHKSKENRDGHLASGMEGGMQESFDRLERLLASLAAPARPSGGGAHRE